MNDAPPSAAYFQSGSQSHHGLGSLSADPRLRGSHASHPHHNLSNDALLRFVLTLSDPEAIAQVVEPRTPSEPLSFVQLNGTIVLPARSSWAARGVHGEARFPWAVVSEKVSGCTPTACLQPPSYVRIHSWLSSTTMAAALRDLWRESPPSWHCWHSQWWKKFISALEVRAASCPPCLFFPGPLLTPCFPPTAASSMLRPGLAAMSATGSCVFFPQPGDPQVGVDTILRLRSSLGEMVEVRGSLLLVSFASNDGVRNLLC